MQIEAIHDSYKKVLSLRFTDDKSKADTMRVAMDGKVDIKAIKRFSTKEIENLVYKFEENLELMGLLDVAEGSRAGSIEEEKRLKRAILRWVSDDERIMTSMRTKMGTASTGSDAYEHVCVYFVKPMVGDTGSDAEKAFLEIDFLGAPLGSVGCCGILWGYVGVLWGSVVWVPGVMWCSGGSMGLCGVLWGSVRVLWGSVRLCGVLWGYVGFCGVLEVL